MRQYEADIHYDANGHIVFTPSQGLPGVGLPCKTIMGDTSYTLTTPVGTREGVALGWEDIRNLREGTTTRHITDDTHPDGPTGHQIVYDAPFDYCYRKLAFQTAWASDKNGSR